RPGRPRTCGSDGRPWRRDRPGGLPPGCWRGPLAGVAGVIGSFFTVAEVAKIITLWPRHERLSNSWKINGRIRARCMGFLATLMTAATVRRWPPQNSSCNTLITNQLELTGNFPAITPGTPTCGARMATTGILAPHRQHAYIFPIKYNGGSMVSLS